MDRSNHRMARRERRRIGIRKRVSGTPERPRLAVFRSSKHMYVQVIDDLGARTICSASTLDKGVESGEGGKSKAAAAVGKLIASRAKESGVSRVVFDRSGFKYHGRLKALADAARAGGLEF